MATRKEPERVRKSRGSKAAQSRRRGGRVQSATADQINRLRLVLPTTTSGRLEWIERHRVPNYLDQRVEDPGGGTWFIPPRDRASAYRHEIQRVYQEAFKHAVAAGRLKVLRRYASNFPQYAFDPDGWLWQLWQGWRTRFEKDDQRLLNALASGIRARGSGWMPIGVSRVRTLALAKEQLLDWRRDKPLKRLYDLYAESARSPDPDIRGVSQKRVLRTLLAAIKRRTGHQTSSAELQKRKLSGVLRLAASQTFGVRERDLH
jgi:hypothetical protein